MHRKIIYNKYHCVKHISIFRIMIFFISRRLKNMPKATTVPQRKLKYPCNGASRTDPLLAS